MSDVRPFRFEIPDGTLNDLKRRLAETRWPERETPKDWSQGVPLAYTQEVCEYWRTRYDWRRWNDSCRFCGLVSGSMPLPALCFLWPMRRQK